MVQAVASAPPRLTARGTTAAATVVVEDVRKSYNDVHALNGVSLQVPQGTVLGLLGPNGAGKTTLVRTLTTLLRPDSGRATVAGYDVVRDAEALRASIGLAGQAAAVDDYLTGLENLEMVGRLYHLPKGEARRRAVDLLERFELSDAGARRASTYSGGMRRRLDLAASLIAYPPVLFLDEPTTGLDPRSRVGMWEVIQGLVDDGTTVLLTTQYLEEADALADRITVIDHGAVIAEGTAAELKRQSAQSVLSVQVEHDADLPEARAILGRLGQQEPHVDEQERRVSVGTDGGSEVLASAVRDLDAAGVRIADLGLRQPTLDDVFLALTGHAAENGGSQDDDADGESARGGV
ncbi:MAG: ATP-binding cassette domain-containing protein [Dehalococcoidia bacterium]|nr:ATP-binding cassette domain-containing protein [Dehalococcoidia bacterium]